MIVMAGAAATINSLPHTYALWKVIKIVVVCYLIWRWRKLTVELNWRFDFLAIPVGVGVFVVWLLLRWLVAGELGDRVGPLLHGQPADIPPPSPDQSFWVRHRNDASVFWPAYVTHLIAMCFAVPMIEEMFNRSVILRSMARPRRTALGLIHVALDLPVVGDWLLNTRVGQQAAERPPVFAEEFNRNELGTITVFGVFASTLVFMLVHLPADWPGCVACGVAYCLLLAATRKKGLGPVIWAHCITNALLWVYVLWSGDWQFL